jgi:WS/DGAT/MGAT family acyltransferase
MKQSLPALDAGWLMLETPETPAHVGALIVLSKPENGPADYLQQLVARLREPVAVAPPWNRRLRQGWFSRWMPMWEIDTRIDLDYHFRHSALPQPGGERELGVLVSRLHSHPLDMRRPLWEIHLIEGLTDDRFAIYAKVHHSVIDGVGGMRMATHALSDTPDHSQFVHPWAIGLASEDSKEEPRPKASSGGKAKPALSLDVVREVAGAFRQLWSAAFEDGNALAAPFTGPRSVLGLHINAQRRFATQQYDLARLRGIAKLGGCTLNDLVMYLSGTALRRFLSELGQLPELPLTAGIAVNLREADDMTAGNAISFMIVSLATQVDDPLKRLRSIQRSAEASKAHLRALSKQALLPYTVLSGVPYALSLLTGLAPFVRPPSSVNISNVPGPERHVYFAGARVEALYPMSMLFHGSALNITCVSYAGTLNFGFTGARDTLPSLQKLAVYMGEAVDEIESLLNSNAAFGASPTAKAKRKVAAKSAKNHNTDSESSPH